jgi:hypothetical protein
MRWMVMGMDDVGVGQRARARLRGDVDVCVRVGVYDVRVDVGVGVWDSCVWLRRVNGARALAIGDGDLNGWRVVVCCDDRLEEEKSQCKHVKQKENRHVHLSSCGSS